MKLKKEYEDEELNKIHNQQIAFAAEPLIPTISSVSFPVFTFNKELEGIISVIGVKIITRFSRITGYTLFIRKAKRNF